MLSPEETERLKAKELDHFNVMRRVEKNADTYKDDIHTPAHYHSGSVDVIGYGEMHLPKEQMEGSHRVNVLKYVTRYDKKGEPLKDLKKARVYLDKLIEIVEGDSDGL